VLVEPLLRPLGRTLRADARRLAAEAGLFPAGAAGAPVTSDALDGLPEPAQRWLRWAGVVGRPRDRAFEARLRGRFRRGRDGPWMPCDAWQVNGSDPVGRVFVMRLDLAHVVPMVGHDTYLDGRGRMHGTLLGLITVADGDGEPFDVGELVTWLNDACMLAPSMLLDDRVTWDEGDGHSFRISVTDHGRTVSAAVDVDAVGALTDFSTTDRFADLGGGPVRAEWRTPVDGWLLRGGRRLPTGCRAVWHLPDGPLPYVDGTFDPDSVTWDPDPPG
jgi:hypothetical protein